MRELPQDEHAERLRMIREQARRDAEALAPRPGRPVYGLAAPSLTPAEVTQYQLSDGERTAVPLTYGRPGSKAEPYVAVTTMTPADSDPPALGGLEAELLRVVKDELHRAAGSADAGESERSEPLVVTRETLPAGPALVCRSRTLWVARLLPSDPPTDSIVVRVVGLGVEPESVRLEPVADVRPMIETRTAMIEAMTERGRRRRPPPRPRPAVELEPAEGVAALLALAEFTLTSSADRRARFQARQRPGSDPDWVKLRNALWQRAASEHQRLRGTDRRAADDAVTVAVNHLGFLQEKAPWFTADSRLRATAIDETLRHPVLGDAVPSDPAQDAWARYWSQHVTPLGRQREPIDPLALMSARETLTADCLRAWAAWAETA
ncbi:MAG TPA: hypothetical protein VH021_01875 [Trebonia sp.]|nr:hypothetical protein [Trebonia sp.]